MKTSSLSDLAVLDDLSTWRIFFKVCAMGSIAAAARDAGSDPSSVSRRIAKLEYALGFELFDRSQRELRPSKRALELRERLTASINSFDATLAGIGAVDSALSGYEVLRICAPCCIAEHIIAPVMEEFQRTRPHLRVQISISDRIVDPDRLDCDFALHCGVKSLGSERSVYLGTFDRVMVASPDYLEREGAPETVDELLTKRLFWYDGQMFESLILHRNEERIRVPFERAHITASTTGPLLGLVRSGKGILLSAAVFLMSSEVNSRSSACLIQIKPQLLIRRSIVQR